MAGGFNGTKDSYIVKKGSTSVTIPMYLVDADLDADVDVDGVDHDTWSAAYYRQGATSAVAISLSAGGTSWSSGGWYNLYALSTTLGGQYLLHVPDAAFATGADWVIISFRTLTVGGTPSVYHCYVDLVDYDPNDGVRLGLTALPNAIPGANGGLLTTDGSKANQTVDLTAGQTVAVSSIGNNVITAASINDGAITNAKVADDVDVNVKTITAGAINSAAFAAGAITEASFANDAISDAKVKSDVTIAAVGTVNGFSTAGKAEIQQEVADGLDSAIPAVPTIGSINYLLKNYLDGKVSDIDTSAWSAAPTVEQIRAEMDSNSTQLAAIRAKTNLFGSGLAQTVNPVLSAERLLLIQGDDYAAADNRSLSWTEDGGWPTLAGTVTLEIEDCGSYACTYSGTAGSQVIVCELTDTQTAAMPTGDHAFNLKYVTTSGGRIISLVYKGVCSVVEQVNYVA